jgi:2,3-bisphosphoglycerate-independent phosphoglycerate mutase
MTRPKPFLLLILDGWGDCPENPGNAIRLAKTPCWDSIQTRYPHTFISGCGEDVGLPVGQMGNSEVGHLTIGAGRVIYQDLTLISKLIENQEFFHNPILLEALAKAKDNHRSMHVMGLLSDGGVHSHEKHLYALLQMALKQKVSKLYIHAFLDGRDTPPKSALSSLERLDEVLINTPFRVATVSGRYYAMDRDKRWERVQRAWEAIVDGESAYEASTPVSALKEAYARGETDEFVLPTCIRDKDEPITIQDGDVVLYFNFRADRARALSWALLDKSFTGFERKRVPQLTELVTFTEYDKNINARVAFVPQQLTNTLGEYFQNLKLKQLRLAETEKYAHVTFFFNGGQEQPFKFEERLLVPSPKVATYDLQPEMSAYELTDILVEKILNQQFDFIVCNYANADMVGHTGKLDAAIKAIEVLDECLAKITTALEKVGGEALITADHGNAECMLDEDNGAHTAHTLSLVPLVYVGQQKFTFNGQPGTLSDIAPTVLTLMHLPIPEEMTGRSLLKSRQ